MRLKPCLLILLLLLLLKSTEANNKNKTLLYQKYPQLNNTNSQCVLAMQKMIMNLMQPDYLDKVFYSSLTLGEIGNYKACEDESNQPLGSHVVLVYNFSSIPQFYRWAFCLPRECDQSVYQQLGDSITLGLNNFY